MESQESSTIHASQVVMSNSDSSDTAGILWAVLFFVALLTILALVLVAYYLISALLTAPTWALAMFVIYMMFKR